MNDVECTHNQAKVLDTRKLPDGRYRRYECKLCKERFATFEIRINEKYKVGGRRKSLDNLYAQMGLSIDQTKAVESLIDAFKE